MIYAIDEIDSWNGSTMIKNVYILPIVGFINYASMAHLWKN